MNEMPIRRDAGEETPALVRFVPTPGWLVLGAGLLLVSNGRWIMPLAAWLAPIAWLVYLERSRPLPGIAGGFALFLLVEFSVWWGIIPAPGVLYFVIAGIYALVYFLPFAIHRLLARRIAGFAATFLFPLAWVSIEFIFHRWITPYGSWAALAYTQSDSLALLQLASLTGVAGLTFLAGWLASISAWILQPGRTARTRRSAVGVYALVLLAVLIFGQLRLAPSRRPLEQVRAAGLVPSAQLTAELEARLAPLRRGAAPQPAEFAALGAIVTQLNEDLFARTRREARAGARIVVWAETAARALKSGEPAFLKQAARVAAEEGVDLVIGYGVYDPGARPPFENKLVAIDARGTVAWQYHKARPIVGAESPIMAAGAGIIHKLETPYGTIGAVICHDLDFPALLRQASREGIGLIVGPSADWPRIASLHSDMARLRTIEGGFSLLRPTSGGRSIVADRKGRDVARVDATADAIVAYVSAIPARTVYGRVGDLFAWLCLAGFMIAVAASLSSKWPASPGA